MKFVAYVAIILCCIASAVLGIVWIICAAITRSPRFWNIALGFDCLGNATTGGNPQEFISTRAAKQVEKKEKSWGCVLCKLLDKIDPGHCSSALKDRIDRDGEQ